MINKLVAIVIISTSICATERIGIMDLKESTFHLMKKSKATNQRIDSVISNITILDKNLTTKIVSIEDNVTSHLKNIDNNITLLKLNQDEMKLKDRKRETINKGLRESLSKQIISLNAKLEDYSKNFKKLSEKLEDIEKKQQKEHNNTIELLQEEGNSTNTTNSILEITTQNNSNHEIKKELIQYTEE